MKRITPLSAFAICIALGTLIPGTALAVGKPTPIITPVSRDDMPIFDDNGDVVDGDDEASEVTIDAPTGSHGKPPAGDGNVFCPEVNDKPTVKLTKVRKFIIDTEDPKSSWLERGNGIEFTTTHTHDIGGSVTVGAEAEAGAFLAKAKAKLDITVSYSYNVSNGIKVSAFNANKPPYRVRLGNMGWRIRETKYYVVPPCKPTKKVSYEIIAPEPGDISFGKFKK